MISWLTQNTKSNPKNYYRERWIQTLYATPVNDRIVHPVSGPRGRDSGYQSGATSQYLWGSLWSFTTNGFGDGLPQTGFLSYTRVADVNLWAAKPDRRFTRTAVIRVGQTQTSENQNNNIAFFLAACVTADCKQSIGKGGLGVQKLEFSNGKPLSQWNSFQWNSLDNDEFGNLRMFIDGKSSDRSFPGPRISGS